jgi:hypothetical protein
MSVAQQPAIGAWVDVNLEEVDKLNEFNEDGDTPYVTGEQHHWHRSIPTNVKGPPATSRMPSPGGQEGSQMQCAELKLPSSIFSHSCTTNGSTVVWSLHCGPYGANPSGHIEDEDGVQ